MSLTQRMNNPQQMQISTEPDLEDHMTIDAPVPNSTTHIRKVAPIINAAHSLTPGNSANHLSFKLNKRLAKGQDQQSFLSKQLQARAQRH